MAPYIAINTSVVKMEQTCNQNTTLMQKMLIDSGFCILYAIRTVISANVTPKPHSAIRGYPFIRILHASKSVKGISVNTKTVMAPVAKHPSITSIAPKSESSKCFCSLTSSKALSPVDKELMTLASFFSSFIFDLKMDNYNFKKVAFCTYLC